MTSHTSQTIFNGDVFLINGKFSALVVSVTQDKRVEMWESKSRNNVMKIHIDTTLYQIASEYHKALSKSLRLQSIIQLGVERYNSNIWIQQNVNTQITNLPEVQVRVSLSGRIHRRNNRSVYSKCWREAPVNHNQKELLKRINVTNSLIAIKDYN